MALVWSVYTTIHKKGGARAMLFCLSRYVGFFLNKSHDLLILLILFFDGSVFDWKVMVY